VQRPGAGCYNERVDFTQEPRSLVDGGDPRREKLIGDFVDFCVPHGRRGEREPALPPERCVTRQHLGPGPAARRRVRLYHVDLPDRCRVWRRRSVTCHVTAAVTSRCAAATARAAAEPCQGLYCGTSTAIPRSTPSSSPRRSTAASRSSPRRKVSRPCAFGSTT